MRLALQRTQLLAGLGQLPLGGDHAVVQQGVALLAVGELHVEFFKAGLGGHAALLQVAQLRVHLGQVCGNLLTAGAGLLSQLRQAQRLHLQLMRTALRLAGFAAGADQALGRICVSRLSPHQRRTGFFCY